MKIKYRLPVAALAAAALLVSLTASAAARQFSLSNQSIRAIWTEPMVITDPTSGTRIRCRMTLEGIFHSRTITKVLNALIGLITAAAITHPCVGEGEVWTHNGIEAPLMVVPATSLPWHITYKGFTGRLPEPITMTVLLRGIRVTGVGKLFGSVVCLAVFGNATESILAEIFINERHEVFAVLVSEQTLLRRETIINTACPANVRLQGSATTVSVLGAATKLSINLI